MTNQQTNHKVAAQVVVNAPAEKVWEVLADFSAVDTWVPFVQSSHIEGVIERGVGIERRCDLGKSGNITEFVTDWNEGESLTYQVSGFGPMKLLVNSWRVRKIDDQSCIVDVGLAYTIKFGFFGRLLNALVLGRVLKKRVNKGALLLLKERVETGKLVRPRRTAIGEPQRVAVAT